MVFMVTRKPWARRREAVARGYFANPNSIRRSCHGHRSSIDIGGHRPVALIGSSLAAGHTADASCAATKHAASAARNFSTADTQPFDQFLVSPLVGAMQIVENLPPLRHELEKPAARVVVLHVGFEVIGQVVNPLRKERDLNFG